MMSVDTADYEFLSQLMESNDKATGPALSLLFGNAAINTHSDVAAIASNTSAICRTVPDISDVSRSSDWTADDVTTELSSLITWSEDLVNQTTGKVDSCPDASQIAMYGTGISFTKETVNGGISALSGDEYPSTILEKSAECHDKMKIDYNKRESEINSRTSHEVNISTNEKQNGTSFELGTSYGIVENGSLPLLPELLNDVCELRDNGNESSRSDINDTFSSEREDRSPQKSKKKLSQYQVLGHQERRERRREQNRLAAQRSRKRKRDKTEATYQEYLELVTSNKDLTEQVRGMREEEACLRQIWETHLNNCPSRWRQQP